MNLHVPLRDALAILSLCIPALLSGQDAWTSLIVATVTWALITTARAVNTRRRQWQAQGVSGRNLNIHLLLGATQNLQHWTTVVGLLLLTQLLSESSPEGNQAAQLLQGPYGDVYLQLLGSLIVLIGSALLNLAGWPNLDAQEIDAQEEAKSPLATATSTEATEQTQVKQPARQPWRRLKEAAAQEQWTWGLTALITCPVMLGLIGHPSPSGSWGLATAAWYATMLMVSLVSCLRLDLRLRGNAETSFSSTMTSLILGAMRAGTLMLGLILVRAPFTELWRDWTALQHYSSQEIQALNFGLALLAGAALNLLISAAGWPSTHTVVLSHARSAKETARE